MEDEWTPQMMETLDIDEASLPVIWDADFLYGPRDAAGADTYVLCEINASSCFAIPDEAPAAIARTVKDRISSRTGSESRPIGPLPHARSFRAPKEREPKVGLCGGNVARGEAGPKERDSTTR